MVIVLAGYDNDMNSLLQVNEGLSSRFPDEVIFRPLNSDHCLLVLEAKLKQKNIEIPALRDPGTYGKLKALVHNLSQFPSWGNARDMETLSKSMVRVVYKSTSENSTDLEVSNDQVFACFAEMLKDKERRSSSIPKTHQTLPEPPIQASAPTRTLSPPNVNASTSAKPSSKDESGSSRAATPTMPDDSEDEDSPRDDAVADAIWDQLQKDKRAVKLHEKAVQQDLEYREEALRQAEAAEKAAIQEALRLKNEEEASERLREREEARLRDMEHKEEMLRKLQEKNAAEALERLRLREEARIREAEARAERERIKKEWERRQLEEQQRCHKEAQVQNKLRQIGVCVQGYQWIKQGGGYRCSAGGHFISDSQLGI